MIGARPGQGTKTAGGSIMRKRISRLGTLALALVLALSVVTVAPACYGPSNGPKASGAPSY